MQIEYVPASTTMPVNLLIVGAEGVVCNALGPRPLAWEVDETEFRAALALSTPVVLEIDGAMLRVNNALMVPPDYPGREWFAQLAALERHFIFVRDATPFALESGTPAVQYCFLTTGAGILVVSWCEYGVSITVYNNGNLTDVHQQLSYAGEFPDDLCRLRVWRDRHADTLRALKSG